MLHSHPRRQVPFISTISQMGQPIVEQLCYLFMVTYRSEVAELKGPVALADPGWPKVIVGVSLGLVGTV